MQTTESKHLKMIHYWLVVKKTSWKIIEFVNGKDDMPYIMGNKKCLKPPNRPLITTHLSIILYILSVTKCCGLCGALHPNAWSIVYSLDSKHTCFRGLKPIPNIWTFTSGSNNHSQESWKVIDRYNMLRLNAKEANKNDNKLLTNMT